MAHTTRVDGETTVGSPREQSTFAIDTKPGTASGLVFLDITGQERVLWFDSNGSLRTGSRTDFLNSEAGGATVGSQV